MISLISGLLRGLRQDLRSKELKWLLIALTLSVSALTSVSFLADRMHRAFEFDARQLLAADLLLVADQPIPEQFIQEADKQKLQTAQTVVFPSMATVGSESKLTSVKAVSSSYPLRGALQLQGLVNNPQEKIAGLGRGNAWVEPGLLNSLHAKVGDSIRLGEREFVIAGVITRELDRGAGFMNFAPRLMIALDDLPSTGLIGLGSRVTYRFLLAGSDESITAYQTWATDYIQSQNLRGIRIETLDNAQPTMRKTLERAEQFLSLVAMLTAMIAGVAIALSARRYMVKQADACATLKCFGATKAMILYGQIKTLILLGFIAAVAGCLLGYLIQSLLIGVLGDLIATNLPSISIAPVIWSVLFTWFLLLGFAGPSMMALVNVSPIRLIRKEFAPLTTASIWVGLFGLCCSGALIFFAAQDWKLALWVGASFLAAILVFSVLAYALLKAISKVKSQGFATQFVFVALSRNLGFVTMQITTLGIAIMALLLILLLRQDLLSTWQGNIPADAPNRFMINIQGDQKQGVANTLRAGGVGEPEFYPMVRGRLTQINRKDIYPADFPQENARRLVDREFNLSYTTQLPPGNRIVSGQWLNDAAPQISMEAGIAKTLNLKLGDQLTYEVAGEKITAPITSLRKLDWGSMRVNFFVIMPPAQLAGMPQSWITSYYQSPELESLDFALCQQFPNLTLVDVSASLQQIQEIINKLSAALSLLFAFTMIASMLVLISAIAATQDERFRNAALLKALGASRAVLANIARIELLLIGAIAGLLAGIAAGIAAWALGRYVLEIEFNAFAQTLSMGIGFGIVASLAAGYRFQARIQQASAIESLREA
ncbi:ABC transporter permease [Polynucleobacter sp. UK-Kesae-W10]|uniref:ABC transporter permease n=1 Tax=Polynucleobacter sp. UK-Kesae-W10 TaxID=1819738 RepID=UPI001C0AFE47|nr:FtsX-like permease family protein [Polynucleobacter sp. UK-Kesae-W10]MBU3578073.1 FtsX-like permease family protein [Polynucleobacter sp. UK-Kesae-W10]